MLKDKINMNNFEFANALIEAEQKRTINEIAEEENQNTRKVHEDTNSFG